MANQSRVSGANPSVRRLLVALDSAVVDGKRAPDARRTLSDEANNLRAAIQRGDAEHIRRVAAEAKRVLDMWGGY